MPGGILYDKDLNKVWESDLGVDKLDPYRSGFIDINNDGNDEIILIDGVNHNYSSCITQIFAIENGSVRMITPYTVLNQQGVDFKSPDIRGCDIMEDIDGDGTIEFVYTRIQMNTHEDIEELWTEEVTKTFKYNGYVYELVSEERILLETRSTNP